MWGLEEEPKWKVMRVDRVQYGPLFLANVAVVEFPKDRMEFFREARGHTDRRPDGLECACSIIASGSITPIRPFTSKLGRMFNFPDFDVIGLILRPEDDGRFTILGVADFEGKPSVPSGRTASNRAIIWSRSMAFRCGLDHGTSMGDARRNAGAGAQTDH